MKIATTLRSFRLLLMSLVAMTWVGTAVAADLPEGFQKMEWTVGDVKREAIVYAPASASETPAPLVFVFHGHGGTSLSAAHSMDMFRKWPEAISVYMQGLNTPGKLTDPDGKKPGWQSSEGLQGDRDLKFFDAVLATLKEKYKVDSRRIYSTGHSNGGTFTYLLWQTRGDVFAAVAPSASITTAPGKLKPLPAMHLAGENDPLVKFEWQKKCMDLVRKINGCDAEGTSWDNLCTQYPSKTGTPFVAFIHPGTHTYPKEGPALIVKFFKEHQKS